MFGRYRRYRRFHGFGDLGAARGFLPTMGDIRTFAIAGVSGAAGIAGFKLLLNYLWPKVDTGAVVPAWARDLIGMALGVIGATLLSRWRRDVAIGFGTGIVASGLASIALRAAGQGTTLGFAGVGGLRGLRGLRGAAISLHRPGRPELATPTRPSPMAGMVISQRKVAPYLMS